MTDHLDMHNSSTGREHKGPKSRGDGLPNILGRGFRIVFYCTFWGVLFYTPLPPPLLPSSGVYFLSERDKIVDKITRVKVTIYSQLIFLEVSQVIRVCSRLLQRSNVSTPRTKARLFCLTNLFSAQKVINSLLI